jgi:hypothetical protein
VPREVLETSDRHYQLHNSQLSQHRYEACHTDEHRARPPQSMLLACTTAFNAAEAPHLHSTIGCTCDIISRNSGSSCHRIIARLSVEGLGDATPTSCNVSLGDDGTSGAITAAAYTLSGTTTTTIPGGTTTTDTLGGTIATAILGGTTTMDIQGDVSKDADMPSTPATDMQ